MYRKARFRSRALKAALFLAVTIWSAAQSYGSNERTERLIITENGLLDQDQRALVLDVRNVDNLKKSLREAQRYFEVRQVRRNPARCGALNELPLYPQYELWREGKLYACVQIKFEFSGEDFAAIYFVGPLRDRFGATPGDRLTEINQFKPLRDCDLPEGILTCRPSYAGKHHNISYEVRGCNAEEEIDEKAFRLNRGNIRLCAIYVWQMPKAS